MKSKNTIILIKVVSFICIPFYFFAITTIFTVCGAGELWGDMFNVGIHSFLQWFTLVLYRFLLYIALGLIIAIYRFDKRYKYVSRTIIWLNWTLFVYLLLNAIIKVFAIDLLCQKIELFSVLDGIVALCGYVFTYIKKRKIEFDSAGVIINEKQ